MGETKIPMYRIEKEFSEITQEDRYYLFALYHGFIGSFATKQEAKERVEKLIKREETLSAHYLMLEMEEAND
jgi:hypothetical protein